MERVIAPGEIADLLNPAKVTCSGCASEVPLDEALIPEAVGYVIYFCGLDCYARWREAAGCASPAGWSSH